MNSCVAESISKLVHMKELKLCSTSEKIMIDIFKKLPTLEYLSIDSCKDMSAERVEKILSHGKNLSMFSLRGENMVIDRNVYNSILNMSADRVKVVIVLRGSTVNVKKDALQANSEWLRIKCLEVNNSDHM